MKIGFVCPDDLSTIIFAKSFIKRLKKDTDYDLYSISPVVGDYLNEINSLGGVHIPVEMDRFFNPIKDLRYLISLYKICRKEKFDAVINWTTKPNVYGAIAERMAGVRNITCAVRGMGTPFLKQVSLKGKILKLILSFLYGLSCRLSTRVWFTNDMDVEYFLSHHMVQKRKIVKTKNAVNLEDFCMDSVNSDHVERLREEFKIDPSEMIVVMVARMIWSKGIKEFVEACEILQERQHKVKFLLVAPLEESQADSVPVSFIKEKEENCNLLWLNFRKDVKEIYALSDISVLPSYYNEGGYPRALLEPMALKKPVITTTLPQCRGPVEDGKNGYLIPPKDSKALADAIESLIVDPDKMQRFGRYSLDKMIKEFDDRAVIQQILTEVGII